MVKSRSHPARMRVVKPKLIETIFAMDEVRKRKAHGFDRSDGCDRTRQFKIFPIVPKSKIIIEK
jgi:hypothetical protein